jgi:excisionase family DNA binding protein
MRLSTTGEADPMQTNEISIPQGDSEQFRELYRILQLGVPKLIGPDGEEVALPSSVYKILKEVARNMQMGRAVSVVPTQEQLTTQMAANILGCSRPHLIKLLSEQQIPYQKVGMHRRVRFDDLMLYQRKRDTLRKNALNELAKEAVSDGTYQGTPIPDGGSDE